MGIKEANPVLLAAIAAVFCAMFLVVAIPKHCKVVAQEGFQGNGGTMTSTSCPADTKSYIDKSGNLNCCSGQVNGSVCEGKIRCTFSPGPSNDYPVCSRTAIMYGPGMSKEKVVDRIDTLPNGKTLYSVQDGKYTKIVSSDEEARYYEGAVYDFIPAAFGTYNYAGANYRIRFT